MLQIRRIEIDKFVCFERLELQPSTSPERPLTVVRAENGSGKTTLLRAIRWGMYGEDGLPGDPSRFSLHPPDWHPDESGVQTKVAIVFETDGSNRDNLKGGRNNRTYELSRTVRTIAAEPSRADDPDFRRIDEEATLLVELPNGSWEPHDVGVKDVIAQLLPGNLRDFFVMDADEAADYVGGSENKVIQRKDVIEKTSFAVRSLLGLEVFTHATRRVRDIVDEFGRSATKAVGDETLTKKQAQLDKLQTEAKRLSDKADADKQQRSDLEDRFERAQGDLERLVGSMAAHEELQRRLADNRERRGRVEKQRQGAVERLSRELTNIDLLGSLAAREVLRVRAVLQPLYDDGSIPIRHLVFVQGLLEKGICVCGQDLTSESEHRHNLKDLVAQSEGKAENANYLAQVLDAADSLHRRKNMSEWEDRCSETGAEVADLEEELGRLDQAKDQMDAKIKGIDNDEVQITKSKIEALRDQLRGVERELGGGEETLVRYRKEIHELEGVIRNQTRRQREARSFESYRDTAAVLVLILDRAYATIRDDQVAELSNEMERLFAMMAQNVMDDDGMEDDRPKATLRMIARVGLQPVEGDSNKFEIFALNSRGRSMPPTEINGASRRILALSFVLALCKVSRTNAPLVADSLLNFMSGSVRTNTLKVTSETASQPILLLTGADLESEDEVRLASEYGGATYTLTGQWQHGDEPGDVVHLSDPRQVSLLCSCGPRQFCDVCERHGQAGSPGWARRPS